MIFVTRVCDQRAWAIHKEVVQLKRDQRRSPALDDGECALMTPKDCGVVQTESSPARPVVSALQSFALKIGNEVIRGVRAIDSCLDAFYLPAEAQAEKRKFSPNKTDPIRLHGLGVRW